MPGRSRPPAAFLPDHSHQCQTEQPLIAHGFSRRTLVKAAFDGSIRVHPCLCRFCGRTVLLLLKLSLSYLDFAIMVISPFLLARKRKAA